MGWNKSWMELLGLSPFSLDSRGYVPSGICHTLATLVRMIKTVLQHNTSDLPLLGICAILDGSRKGMGLVSWECSSAFISSLCPTLPYKTPLDAWLAGWNSDLQCSCDLQHLKYTTSTLPAVINNTVTIHFIV